MNPQRNKNQKQIININYMKLRLTLSTFNSPLVALFFLPDSGVASGVALRKVCKQQSLIKLLNYGKEKIVQVDDFPFFPFNKSTGLVVFSISHFNQKI